jgi:hypothetical protein
VEHLAGAVGQEGLGGAAGEDLAELVGVSNGDQAPDLGQVVPAFELAVLDLTRVDPNGIPCPF